MNRLKELRLKHGFKNQKELADFLYVNQTAVSQWERGVTVPSSPMLLKLSEIYGVSVDYLLGRDEKKDPAPVSEGGLDETAQRFMPLVDKLTPDQQMLLLAQLQAWTKQNEQPAPAVPHSSEETALESDS